MSWEGLPGVFANFLQGLLLVANKNVSLGSKLKNTLQILSMINISQLSLQPMLELHQLMTRVIKKEQIVWLVEHWCCLIPACDLFRFSHVLINSKTDATTPALYEDSLSPCIVAQMRPHIGADMESGTSTQPRTMASTLGWDDEYQAVNPLWFSPGPDGINMHDND